MPDDHDHGHVPVLIDRCVELLRPALTRHHPDGAGAVLVDATLGAGGHTERFLTELTLDPPEATSDQAGPPLLDEDYLILSTIHSAKGQEWTAVSVLNVVDGCIPSDMATGSVAEIEEERRLLYVAMTRAKEHLDLIVPQRFYVSHQPGFGDRHLYANRTRFIPNALLPCFEQVAWPAPAAASPANPNAKQQALDLAARMRAMWK